MPIFPEHLHVAGEDARLHDVEMHDRTRLFVDGYIIAMIIAVLLIAAVIVALLAI